MRSARFKNDALGFDAFDGFSKEEEWNGWDCPYFTFEQAQKVLQTANELRGIIGEPPAYYDQEKDAFVFPTEDEPEIYQALSEGGVKYYPVGTFVWIWEESEEPSGDKSELTRNLN